MRRFCFWLSVLLAVFSPVGGRGQTQQVEVVVNQIGSVPAHGLNTIQFKFVILVVSSGTPATATAAFASGKVTGFNITNSGTGYTAAPTVTITGGGGTGARATAVLSNGMIASLHLVAAGSKYTSAPTVTIGAPTGHVTTTLWSNDGTSVAGSEPLAAVPLQVVDSTYSAFLGYTGLLNMAALPSDVLSYMNARVRVWYKTAAEKNFVEVVPDSPLQTVPYAEQASYATMAGAVPDGSITAAQIAPGTISTLQIPDGSITAAQIASGTITATQIASGTITGAQIASGTITALQIPDGSITAAQIASGTITGTQIASGTITGAQIASGTIMGAQIASGTITAAQIAPGAIPPPSGALLASLSPSDATLMSQGYTKVQSLPGQSWIVPSVSGAPSPRSGHTAIWTGASMIVWGGTVSSSLSNQGGEYNVASSAWFTLPTVNAPAPRSGHTAVWTGSQMIVWGGDTSANPGGDASGGVYNDATAAWQAMATASAPSARTLHTAVWTGSNMIIWGGNSPNGALPDGGSYTPPTSPTDLGSWTSIPASSIAGVRQSHTAVWTGSAMIIWGGLDANANTLNTGAAYDPVAKVWTALPTLNAPSARFGHSAIWTGSQMIVFGGSNSTTAGPILNDGAIYDPVAQAWTALSPLGAPDPRMSHGAVWTGSEMLVFSGQGASGPLLTAGAFNPATNIWRALPAAPSGATVLTGVWSGTLLLAFGEGGLNTLDPSPTLYLYGKF
jgi:hypothetical protein